MMECCGGSCTCRRWIRNTLRGSAGALLGFRPDDVGKVVGGNYVRILAASVG